MDAGREKLQKVLERLRKERDELRVKAHLGRMEAKDEWEELERKWHQLEARISGAREGAAERSKAVGASAEVVAEEIKAAYQRIRDRLRERDDPDDE